jgi:hypothetical protein
MLEQLHRVLAPVRRRQRLDRGIRWAILALLLGAVVGSALIVVKLLGLPVGAYYAVAVLVASAVLGLVAGLVWPATWQASARVVDARFELKDRTLTALDFARRGANDPIHSLQVHDAIHRLGEIDTVSAAPWRLPRLAPAALVASFVMLLLLFVSFPPSISEADVPGEPLDVVLAQAAVLEETLLEELRELVEETKDPELEQLAEEMKQAVENLKDPEVDQHEALAQLSEMQAALAAAMEQLETQKIDAELQQLAEALQDADSTQAASQSLKESNYEKAAEELEKIEASTMNRKERDAVASNLAKLSSKLGKGKKGQLSESIQEMAEGLSSEDSEQSKSGFSKAAGVCRKQGVKKKIAECLACQLNRLAECKGCCQGQCNKPGSSVAK